MRLPAKDTLVTTILQRCTLYLVRPDNQLALFIDGCEIAPRVIPENMCDMTLSMKHRDVLHACVP